MNWINWMAKFLLVFESILKQLPFASVVRSRSYSQFWEDRLIKRFVRGFQGSYVDVGAGAPIWGSNTYMLYKANWMGVTVDPIKLNIALHKIFRSRDKHYLSLVSNRISNIIFYELDPWELSTTNKQLAEQRVELGAKLIRERVCEVIGLRDIYAQNQLVRPSILSIDVEGSELEVLQSNDWTKFKPDLICVEELVNPLDQSLIRSYLEIHNYSLSAYNGVSSFYTLDGSEYISFD